MDLSVNLVHRFLRVVRFVKEGTVSSVQESTSLMEVLVPSVHLPVFLVLPISLV